MKIRNGLLLPRQQVDLLSLRMLHKPNQKPTGNWRTEKKKMKQHKLQKKTKFTRTATLKYVNGTGWSLLRTSSNIKAKQHHSNQVQNRTGVEKT